MDDRTLLELAAKAAGLEFDSGRQLNPTYYLVREVGSALNDDWRGWNPLANDGDAFRLAVKLQLTIKHRTVDIDVSKGNISVSEHAPTYRDALEATRRAIVRAAAAIGEGMG